MCNVLNYNQNCRYSRQTESGQRQRQRRDSESSGALLHSISMTTFKLMPYSMP